MLIHPQFDPVALAVGPLSIHWYGLMYLAAFGQFWWLGRLRAARHPYLGVDARVLDDLMFYGMLGVVLGGRLGQVLFYEPGHYLSHPGEILALWKGGMSFHGGFIGVCLAVVILARKHRLPLMSLADYVAPLVPLGLAFGRIGNFINGELWGRPASPDLPWAMVFPFVDAVPRHPSQLYQAAMEGLLLFVLLAFYARSRRPAGAVTGVFILFYGVFRFVAEYFRTPDDGIFGWSTTVSMGQWLSLPMVLVGVLLLLFATRSATSSPVSQSSQEKNQ